jgi:hypothetical protein
MSGAPTTSNRSVQRGVVTVQPAKRLTVATLRVGTDRGSPMTARLQVTPASGEPYEVRWVSTP